MPRGFRVDPQSAKQVQALIRDLKKVAPEVEKEARKGFKSAATPILNDTRRRQPKKTGELRSKTRIRFSRGRIEIRSSARHARISEFGGRHPLWGRDQWIKQDPAPAIFPAVDAGRDRFYRNADNALDTACRKAGFT